jgi:DNA-binding NtrC family response regulator
MIAGGASLTDVLANLCSAIDAQSPDIISTVMLLDPDGKRLWPTASARMPTTFIQAFSPAQVGQNMGACGTAAFRKARVIISDIAEAALAESKGRVAGPWGAAARLGIPRQTLGSKIKALHIEKQRFRAP